MSKRRKSSSRLFRRVEDPLDLLESQTAHKKVGVCPEDFEWSELMDQADLDPDFLADKLEPYRAPDEVVKSKIQKIEMIVDLHGLVLADAKESLTQQLWAELESNVEALLCVEVVTGRGRRSGDRGAVLAKEIHPFLCHTFARYIVSIEESPSENMYRGIALRGSFKVVLCKSGTTP